MSNLNAHLRSLIEAKGPMSVADYMQLALQHPEFGYYRRHNPLGAMGDFITAPEISQMFGELIGLWCFDLWKKMGSPTSFVLVELGPGRGSLMDDALRATAKMSGFQNALKLFFIETNETLRQAQQEKLKDREIHYISDLSELPPLPLILIANEFFDALPIRQFEKTKEGWSERLVALADNRLVFITKPLDPSLAILIPTELADARMGTFHEISMSSLALIREVSRHIVRHRGGSLIIDYGYLEAAGKPTLQAVSKHTTVDVLEKPGEIDLTAHVNFDALAKTARLQNAAVVGPLSQGEFLENMGIEIRSAHLKTHASPEEVILLDAGRHRLTSPSEMGALFKVMSIIDPHLSELAGF